VWGKCVDVGEDKDSWREGEPEMLVGSGIGRGTASSDDNIYDVVMT
jgi:hypothetical protein